MGDRAERGADDDGGCRLPQVETQVGDGDDADEYGGELEVGGEPGPEQLDRLAVPFLQGDVLDTSRFDGGDPLPVIPFTNRNVLFDFLHGLHRRYPSDSLLSRRRTKFKEC